MGKQLTAASEIGQTLGTSALRPTHDFEQQCLRVLRCTAHALANSPGGLRFKHGTLPWLDAFADRNNDVSMAVHHGG